MVYVHGRRLQQVESLKLSRGMTDASLRALAAGCTQLRELELRSWGAGVTLPALAALLDACPCMRAATLPAELCTQQLELRALLRRPAHIAPSAAPAKPALMVTLLD